MRSFCPIMDLEFKCKIYGRPNADNLKFLWESADFELLRFNGINFLRKIKGKKVMVLGETHWGETTKSR
ncbi:hypothetical protein L1887_35100 [Cichorium endivia]|nr:hypothetical protein L1887_35100 [Cichorium endivia]